MYEVSLSLHINIPSIIAWQICLQSTARVSLVTTENAVPIISPVITFLDTSL